MDAWSTADFAATDLEVRPSELLKCEQWMVHVEKKPIAPRVDRDHLEANPDEDVRWK